MKTIFFGTPETAVAFLRRLAARSEVLAVVSQPDRPAGRGLGVQPTPVKAAALELGLKTFQPARPSEVAEGLKALAPDLAVVVAYGRLLRRDVLDAPKLGTLNAHFSLLPAYRGAAPVQWSLVRGERRTGVTLFWLDEGMDTGPIQSVIETDIKDDEDAPSLLARLTELGVDLLDRTLADLEAGRIVRRPQEGTASLAPLIKREDALIDLSKPASEIHALVRGFRLWPRAALEKGGPRVLVLKTALPDLGDPPGTGRPGRVLSVERGRGILVECGSRSRLWVLAVQPEGKKTLNAADFANGLRVAEGDFLPFVKDL
ncbi:MAG: methionyl-tRNA formyltransferase [Elusimicrobia bacterium GWC2_65_9]|nr:MAG: methionyl-tRNA formyltransferase [Elusimicrobia bacterium GWA2_66_18]OGR76006.1 MAG: methionyl-tRNA formyltransferase [Elusimicrobia bacterium GWC2_65_9]